MTKTCAFLIVALASCSSDPAQSHPDAAPPSCQQAFGHYYAAGCTFSDSGGNPITESDMEGRCQTYVTTATPACLTLNNRWLTCMLELPSPARSAADCDCSQAQMAVLACH